MSQNINENKKYLQQKWTYNKYISNEKIKNFVTSSYKFTQIYIKQSFDIQIIFL